MDLPYHLGMPGVLARTEQRLRPLYGTGHYSTRDWSQHHHYRRGQAMGPALVAAQLAAIRRGQVPDRNPNFLDDWKHTLGVFWYRGPAEDELRFMRAVALSPRGHADWQIRQGLSVLTNTALAFWTVTNRYQGAGSNGSGLSYRVRCYAPSVLPSRYNAQWAIARWWLWRVTPAHVECVVEFPDLPWGPSLLGTGGT